MRQLWERLVRAPMGLGYGLGLGKGRGGVVDDGSAYVDAGYVDAGYVE